jgi:hypothetical protein
MLMKPLLKFELISANFHRRFQVDSYFKTSIKVGINGTTTVQPPNYVPLLNRVSGMGTMGDAVWITHKGGIATATDGAWQRSPSALPQDPRRTARDPGHSS